MTQFMHVEFSDGKVWRIDLEVIAKSRADYYYGSGRHADEFPTFQSAFDDSMELFIDNSYEAASWAKGDMDWVDVKDFATLWFDPDMNQDDVYENEWCNSNMSVYKGEN